MSARSAVRSVATEADLALTTGACDAACDRASCGFAAGLLCGVAGPDWPDTRAADNTAAQPAPVVSCSQIPLRSKPMAIVNQTTSVAKTVLWIYADRPMMSRALSDINTLHYGRNTPSRSHEKSEKTRGAEELNSCQGKNLSGQATKCLGSAELLDGRNLE